MSLRDFKRKDFRRLQKNIFKNSLELRRIRWNPREFDEIKGTRQSNRWCFQERIKNISWLN